MKYSIKYSEHHNVFFDTYRVEITKNNVIRHQRALDGKVNFYCNKCEFYYWNNYGYYNKIKKLK